MHFTRGLYAAASPAFKKWGGFKVVNFLDSGQEKEKNLLDSGQESVWVNGNHLILICFLSFVENAYNRQFAETNKKYTAIQSGKVISDTNMLPPRERAEGKRYI